MKTIRLLLLGSFLCFCQFAFTQNLLQDGARYIGEKHWIHSAQGVGDIRSFFEDKVFLDSHVNETFYYHIQRTSLYDATHGEFSDSFKYNLKVHDSAIYFSGNVRVKYDSTVYFENELIFDLKLKKNDTLKLRSNKSESAKYIIKKINYIDTLNSYRYQLTGIEGHIEPPMVGYYDTRIGFIYTGLLPYEISAVGFTSQLNTLTICSDSVVYVDKSEFIRFGLFENFCDSLVIDSLIRGYLATDINKTKNNLNFKTYPNPFADYINIDLTNEFYYSIYNVDGRLIVKGRSTNQINTSSLLKGIYIIEIQSETQNMKQMIIKQ